VLQAKLLVAGVKGIIGYDFFNNFKVVIDFKNKKLKYATYN